jgi:hypothetical protein
MSGWKRLRHASVNARSLTEGTGIELDGNFRRSYAVSMAEGSSTYPPAPKGEGAPSRGALRLRLSARPWYYCSYSTRSESERGCWVFLDDSDLFPSQWQTALVRENAVSWRMLLARLMRAHFHEPRFTIPLIHPSDLTHQLLHPVWLSSQLPERGTSMAIAATLAYIGEIVGRGPPERLKASIEAPWDHARGEPGAETAVTRARAAMIARAYLDPEDDESDEDDESLEVQEGYWAAAENALEASRLELQQVAGQLARVGALLSEPLI